MSVAADRQYPLEELCVRFLRPLQGWVTQADGTRQAVFEPPLTTVEQATFADLQTMANFGVSLTLAEWQSIKPDAALLRTFAGIASPTLAQTVAAVKAQSRILGVIIRS